MKKAALTFGLFSLVMVATSFATPQTTSSSIKGIINTTLETDGGGDASQRGKSGKKLDVYSTPDQLNSFASDSQSTRSRVKLD
jgi:hypothetical protein